MNRDTHIMIFEHSIKENINLSLSNKEWHTLQYRW